MSKANGKPGYTFDEACREVLIGHGLEILEGGVRVSASGLKWAIVPQMRQRMDAAIPGMLRDMARLNFVCEEIRLYPEITKPFENPPVEVVKFVRRMGAV